MAVPCTVFFTMICALNNYINSPKFGGFLKKGVVHNESKRDMEGAKYLQPWGKYIPGKPTWL